MNIYIDIHASIEIPTYAYFTQGGRTREETTEVREAEGRGSERMAGERKREREPETRTREKGEKGAGEAEAEPEEMTERDAL